MPWRKRMRLPWKSSRGSAQLPQDARSLQLGAHAFGKRRADKFGDRKSSTPVVWIGPTGHANPSDSLAFLLLLLLRFDVILVRHDDQAFVPVSAPSGGR